MIHALLPGRKKAAVAITDPPYGEDYQARNGSTVEGDGDRHWRELMTEWTKAILRKTSIVYMFCSGRRIGDMAAVWDDPNVSIWRWLIGRRTARRRSSRTTAATTTTRPSGSCSAGGEMPEHEGAADRLDESVVLLRRAGVERITLRGDTDFSQTKHLDRWNRGGVKFACGFQADSNYV